MDVHEKLDKLLEGQEFQNDKLDALQEQLDELEESVKNLNLNARDYGVEEYE